MLCNGSVSSGFVSSFDSAPVNIHDSRWIYLNVMFYVLVSYLSKLDYARDKIQFFDSRSFELRSLTIHKPPASIQCRWKYAKHNDDDMLNIMPCIVANIFCLSMGTMNRSESSAERYRNNIMSTREKFAQQKAVKAHNENEGGRKKCWLFDMMMTAKVVDLTCIIRREELSMRWISLRTLLCSPISAELRDTWRCQIEAVRHDDGNGKFMSARINFFKLRLHGEWWMRRFRPCGVVDFLWAGKCWVLMLSRKLLKRVEGEARILTKFPRLKLLIYIVIVLGEILSFRSFLGEIY